MQSVYAKILQDCMTTARIHGGIINRITLLSLLPAIRTVSSTEPTIGSQAD